MTSSVPLTAATPASGAGAPLVLLPVPRHEAVAAGQRGVEQSLGGRPEAAVIPALPSRLAASIPPS